MTEVSKQLAKPGTILGVTTFWFAVEGCVTIIIVIVTLASLSSMYFIADGVIIAFMHAINVILTREDPDRDQVVKIFLISILSGLGFKTQKYPPTEKSHLGETIYGP